MQLQNQRADWRDQADHSLDLEGLQTSREYEDDADSYVAGEITADQLVQKTRARLGLARILHGQQPDTV